MQIRIKAVHWECGEGIRLIDFLRYLKDKSPPPLFAKVMGREFKSRQRLLYVDEIKPGIWGGLFVTVKSAKAFLKLTKNDNGTIAFVLHQIDEETERVADFNFFVMNVKEGRGAYSHYHQSCSFEDFTHFCRDDYREYRDELIDRAEKEERPTTKRATDEINRRFKNLLYGAPMLTKGDIAKLVKQLAEIDTLELQFTEIATDQDFAKPLRDVAKIEKRSYRLDKSISRQRLRDAVTKAIQLASVERGRVVGQSDDSLTRIVDLRRNLGIFSELDFRETVAKELFDVTNLRKSKTLQAMVDLIEDPDYAGLFELQERRRKDEVGDE